ncbi:unnamed protein product [Ceratitis capitata]|uniref:(Mediterranean fruit fly) hypothetical protein n=1 Tax=Ceratitis capitata TaxID=7213 RepID=A0A811TYS9_CERCA|nr:unnamed protein product [Ceratitis capitata]
MNQLGRPMKDRVFPSNLSNEMNNLQTTNNNKQSTSFQAVLSRVIGLINIATKRVVRITTLPPSAAAIDGINS